MDFVRLSICFFFPSYNREDNNCYSVSEFPQCLTDRFTRSIQSWTLHKHKLIFLKDTEAVLADRYRQNSDRGSCWDRRSSKDSKWRSCKSRVCAYYWLCVCVCVCVCANCEVKYNKGDCFYSKALLLQLTTWSKVLKAKCVCVCVSCAHLFYCVHNVHIHADLQSSDLIHAPVVELWFITTNWELQLQFIGVFLKQ